MVNDIDTFCDFLTEEGVTHITGTFILAFFGVLGGLAAFGLVGLFLGPVILAVAFAVWQEWLEAHPTSAIAEANVRKGLS